MKRTSLSHLLSPPNAKTALSIKFFRMSSEMFPFASHPNYGYDLSYVDAELKEIGALAQKFGHRLTSHPGQFTQIASPKENVVEASVKELDCE
jgi:UV DNA damage endonuclease